MTRLYRKRPIIVEARRIDVQDWDQVLDIAHWCRASIVDIEEFLAQNDKAVMAVDTLEGIMYADDGDWIVRGARGDFRPIKDATFQETYEAVQ